MAPVALDRTIALRLSVDGAAKFRLTSAPMSARYVALILIIASTAISCSDEDPAPPTTPDAGFETPDTGGQLDAEPIDRGVDVGFPDAGFGDAGPPADVGVRFAQVSCGECEVACDLNLCLRNNNGEFFCSDRCDTDLDGCVDGFSCVDITGGAPQPAYFCIPPGASCVADGAGFGARCSGGISTCALPMTHCEGDVVSAGFCTTACGGDGDCPPNYFCGIGDDGDQVCKPLFTAANEQCARGYDLSEIPCAVDSDCNALADAVCVRSSSALPGVCALTCANAAECPSGDCVPTSRGSVCLSDRCACHIAPDLNGERDLVGEALSAIGLSRCDAIFSIHDWASEAGDLLFDPYRLSFFNGVHNQPLSAPQFGDDVVEALEGIASQGSPSARAARMVERLAELADRPAERTPPGTIDAIQPLATAMADLIREAGGAPDTTALTADAADVPMDLQLAAAEIVDGLRRALIARRDALGFGNANAATVYDFGPAFVARRRDLRGLPAASDAVRSLLNDDFDYGRMYGAAVDLLDAIDRADLERFAQAPTSTASAERSFLFNGTTPIGRVVIAGADSHLYRPDLTDQGGAWALLIDLGGNDEYRGPVGGNIDANNVASVLIDLGGEDTYAYVEVAAAGDEGRLPSDNGGRYSPAAEPTQDNGPISLSEVPRQGAGRAGTGILIDLGGDDDRYRSLRMSQGVGLFGTGVLVDDGGNDIYEAEAVAQGAAAFGIGVHLDLGGSDVRRAYQMAQGFAYARAIGVSYDASGDDTYFMDPGDPSAGGDPLYFSGQRPGRANTSLGQGFGFGRRNDVDRAYMSGGVGLLIDRAGNDRYTSSIFAQGSGFWFGTGMLVDREGNDVYDALWYAMGTGAHYSLGLLMDRDGDDDYGGTLPRVNVTVGGAHDYTTAFLIDDAGNDDYRGSRISLGAGNVNGFGVFIDRLGDDTYDVRSPYAIGSAGLLERGPSDPGNARRKVSSIGIFIDASGQDVYTLSGEAAMPYDNDSSWLQSNNEDPAVAATELGVGIDGEGTVSLQGR